MSARPRTGSVLSRASTQAHETVVASRARETTEVFKSTDNIDNVSEEVGEKTRSRLYRSMRIPNFALPDSKDLTMEHNFNLNKRKESFTQFFKKPTMEEGMEGEELGTGEDGGVQMVDTEVDFGDVYSDAPGTPRSARMVRKGTMYEVASIDESANGDSAPEPKTSLVDSQVHILTMSRRGKQTQSIVRRSGNFQGSLRQMPEVNEMQTLNSLEADDAAAGDAKARAGRMKIRPDHFGASSGRLMTVNTASSERLPPHGSGSQKGKKTKTGSRSNKDSSLISYATKHLRKIKDSVGL